MAKSKKKSLIWLNLNKQLYFIKKPDQLAGFFYEQRFHFLKPFAKNPILTM
jgi:hypothetical protein